MSSSFQAGSYVGEKVPSSLVTIPGHALRPAKGWGSPLLPCGELIAARREVVLLRRCGRSCGGHRGEGERRRQGAREESLQVLPSEEVLLDAGRGEPQTGTASCGSVGALKHKADRRDEGGHPDEDARLHRHSGLAEAQTTRPETMGCTGCTGCTGCSGCDGPELTHGSATGTSSTMPWNDVRYVWSAFHCVAEKWMSMSERCHVGS